MATPLWQLRRVENDLRDLPSTAGTYLGDSDTPTDAAVEAAVLASVAAGWNVIDSAINYRGQRGERSVGRALRRLLRPDGGGGGGGERDGEPDGGGGGGAGGRYGRDELWVATKAGFVPSDAEAAAPSAARKAWVAHLAPALADGELVEAKHCIAPRCLEVVRHEEMPTYIIYVSY